DIVSAQRMLSPALPFPHPLVPWIVEESERLGLSLSLGRSLPSVEAQIFRNMDIRRTLIRRHQDDTYMYMLHLYVVRHRRVLRPSFIIRPSFIYRSGPKQPCIMQVLGKPYELDVQQLKISVMSYARKKSSLIERVYEKPQATVFLTSTDSGLCSHTDRGGGSSS
ncbi:hypothetical protein L249_3562, partial [Ophiocordyceps polyrhachis-furcata BCC 54312]